MRQTRNSIYSSAIALVLCIVMLTGTTFAWFTDIATSSDNVIQSGRLDAELYWSNELLASDSDEWIDASGNAVFTHNNWEPGYTDVKYIKVKNNGTLNFKWKLTVEADGPVTSLSDVIEVYYVNPVTTQLTSLEGLASVGTLTEVMMDKTNSTGRLTPGQDAILAIAFHMDELSGNEYQDTSLCDNGFSLKLLATQDVGENDSFGDDYDLDADWEEGSVNFTASASLSQVPLIYGSLAGNVTIGDQNGVSAFIPTGVKVADGTSSLDLSINRVDDDNITLDDGATSSSLDVHIEGIAADNTVPMTVNLGAVLQPGLDVTELKLYHIENDIPVLMTRVNTSADFAVHNQYTYNPTTGEVSIYVASFSVFSAVKTSADVWDGEAVANSFASGTGTEADPYIIETAAQLVYFRNQVDAGVTYAGQFVKLGKDIDLADKPFDPIGFGYWKEAKVENDVDKNTVFMGTFDGGNHTIYNLYQNGWELDPDKTNYRTYTYSTAGAGLFASIKNATIKNLAISGAEVVFECVDMGIVVGYAQGECHFENIVVTNANIANYNRYTGGLVGEVSGGVDKNGDGYSHTFKNITIDSTVTVSGLWGSFGCGMGGVIGGKWGDATVLMENVISAPVMDVYNDVVSAYQWYAFRGCGMLIGHTEEPYSDGRTSGIATASFLTCKNVKVYYGDWVNYTYYQFANQTDSEGNTLWYSNYPWVRAEEGVYCDAFSNIRYGIPLINGTKVTELGEEKFNAAVTGSTPIIFDQLYGADRGMYGQAKHEGVEVIYGLGETKTIYIYNDQNWENLKLHYWYRNGDDTWTNVSADGASMDNMELSNFENVYRLRLPAYVDGFMITDGTNESEFTLAGLENDGIYTLGGAKHEHSYTEGKCECGAYETGKWTLVTDASTLQVGDQIIIVAVSADYAIGITQADNNRPAVAIVKNPDGTVNITENVQILTLVEGTTDGTFGLYTGSGYLYAASSSSNHLKTQATNNDNGSWAIKVTDGVASIVAEGSSDRNVMQYNPNNGSPLFACYASASQKAIAIYTLRGNNESIVEPHNCLEYATGATCTDNATCTKCAQVIPNTAIGHNHESVVTEATCTKGGYTTHTCSKCGDKYVTDETEALGHIFDGDSCSVCGETKPQVGGTKTYVFANYTAGTQYAKNEEHKLDDNTTIVTTECHFTDELRIYSSSTNNGYAIVKSANPITSIGVNAGYKVDTLVIYGSNDEGKTWTEAATISVTSTSYKDYTADFDVAYQWLKIDVKGSNQVRLESMTLTTGEPCEHTNTTTNTVAATCTEAGTTTITCDDCGATVHTEVIEATGHQHTTKTTVAATCTEAGTTTITCDDCGETISTEEIPATGEHTYVDGSCTVCGASEPVEPTHECESKCAECGKCTDAECTEDACTDKCEGHSNALSNATLSFSSTANRTSFSTSQQVWSANGVTLTNDKGSSSSNVADYSNPARFYKSSKITIEASGMTKIVFTCNSSSYATALKNSIKSASNYEVTMSGSTVTVTFVKAVDSFVIESLTGGQVRMNSLVVNPN